jgi:GH25 family lysozyme M1 (1,4-beta-N-acetylmuramidase)
MRVTDSAGNIYPESAQQLNYAKSAGYIPDIYFTPNRNNSATAQVNALMTNIPSSLFGIIWIYIGGWSSFSAESNCAYLQELINSIKLKGKNPGIYTYIYNWSNYFGDRYACPAAGSQPLWYSSP